MVSDGLVGSEIVVSDLGSHINSHVTKDIKNPNHGVHDWDIIFK